MAPRALTAAAVVALISAACGSSTTTDPAASTTTQAATSTTQAISSDSTSTRAGIEAAQWASDMTVEITGDQVHIVSGGVPDHDMPEQFAIPADPVNISADGALVIDNPVVSQDYDYTIPLNPVYAETPTDTELGLIGLLISGAALFNSYEGGGSYALDANFEVDGAPFIDSCNAHPQGEGIYHYHGVPYCISSTIDIPGAHSTIVGVLLDGFPVYGPQDVGGDAPTDLDECNGHFGATPEFPDGIYHYHLSETAPYSIDCYHGGVDTSITGAGGAGGGTTGPDLTAAAATLGVTEADLQAALGTPPPDLAAAATSLGVTEADLQAALGVPG